MKQSALTQNYFTKEYKEYLHTQNTHFLHQLQQYPLPIQHEFIFQFCKFIGIEINNTNKLNEWKQLSSDQIQTLLQKIVTLEIDLGNELFYFHCIQLTRSFPDIFPSFFSHLDLPFIFFHLLTIVKIVCFYLFQLIYSFMMIN